MEDSEGTDLRRTLALLTLLTIIPALCPAAILTFDFTGAVTDVIDRDVEHPGALSGYHVFFSIDSFTLVTPEPATWICATVGFILIVLRRRP